MAEQPRAVSRHDDVHIPPLIEVVRGPQEGEKFHLVNYRVVIGRDPDCDICFNISAMSRFHAQFIKLDNGYAFEDLGSRCGSRINGTSVGERHVLSDGDRIHTGSLVLVYRCSS